MPLKRKIFETADGSQSIFIEGLNESYHSIHGAKQESMHVFIENGLQLIKNKNINILEVGFGTGLNCLLSFEYAIKNNKNILFTTIEKYPLEKEEWQKLNFSDQNISQKFFKNIHLCNWGNEHLITPYFRLHKSEADLTSFIPKENSCDIIYFDAFAPNVQPELWTEQVFTKMYNALTNNGILTTYSSKGTVKQALRNAGFKVIRIQGPQGKRHILRAIKKE